MADKRIGNQFWKARSTHGRNPIFKDSDQMWDACCQYFKWADENPLWESKATQFQGAQVDMEVPKMRAMTLAGLRIFLDIAESTWSEYRQKKDFMRVTSQVEDIIYSQKFAGAAADLLNANIIARDLGLVDKQEKAHKGNIGLTDMSSDELDRKLAEYENKVEQSTKD